MKNYEWNDEFTTWTVERYFFAARFFQDAERNGVKIGIDQVRAKDKITF